MKVWMIAFLSIALLGCVSAAPRTAETQAGACSPQAGLSFICGPQSVEDFVHIPRTHLLVGGSFPLRGGVGGLYLFDTRSHAWRPIPLGAVAAAPDRFPCAGPPDWGRFVAHGLALKDSGRGVHTLFVVNHGGREAIEVFELRVDDPRATWIGCVPMPEGVVPNSVVPTPEGGLLFTMTFNPEPWPVLLERFVARRPAGGVFEWRPGQGVRSIKTPGISGPNGIQISADGEQIFVAGWADGTVTRIDRATGASIQIEVRFLADNLHWAPDGALLLAGQVENVADSIACGTANPPRGRYCAMRGMIVKIDPRTMQIISQWPVEGAASFGDLTAALEYDGKFWLGSLFGDRIALMDARR